MTFVNDAGFALEGHDSDRRAVIREKRDGVMSTSTHTESGERLERHQR